MQFKGTLPLNPQKEELFSLICSLFSICVNLDFFINRICLNCLSRAPFPTSQGFTGFCVVPLKAMRELLAAGPPAPPSSVGIQIIERIHYTRVPDGFGTTTRESQPFQTTTAWFDGMNWGIYFKDNEIGLCHRQELWWQKSHSLLLSGHVVYMSWLTKAVQKGGASSEITKWNFKLNLASSCQKEKDSNYLRLLMLVTIILENDKRVCVSRNIHIYAHKYIIHA